MLRISSLIIICVVLILIAGCSPQKKIACDEAVEPMCDVLTADKPPMEIQPEIGERINEDVWRATRTLEGRKTLIKHAWRSRKVALAEGFIKIEERVMAFIDDAAREARQNPKRKLDIYKRAEDEIRATTFGPATAALPFDDWIEVLKHEMRVE